MSPQISVPHPAQAPTLRIIGPLTISTVGDWYSQMSSVLSASLESPAIFDFSEVEEFDTAGLQLLLVMRRMVRETSCSLSFIRPAPCIHEILALCGLTELISTADHDAAPEYGVTAA